MSKPIILRLTENGKDTFYGILVDKINNKNCSKITVAKLPENLIWEDAIKKDNNVLILSIDNLTGKMASGEYEGKSFGRTKTAYKRLITEVGGNRYVPNSYKSDNWSMITIGEHSKLIDTKTEGSDALGSLFWGMTSQNASITAK